MKKHHNQRNIFLKKGKSLLSKRKAIFYPILKD